MKARLSAYLKEVAGGEVVLVTDRGRVVAELRSPGSTVTPESPLERSLRALADAGGLVVAGPHDATAYRRSPVRVPGGTAQELLAEERSEG